MQRQDSSVHGWGLYLDRNSQICKIFINDDQQNLGTFVVQVRVTSISTIQQ